MPVARILDADLLLEAVEVATVERIVKNGDEATYDDDGDWKYDEHRNVAMYLCYVLDGYDPYFQSRCYWLYSLEHLNYCLMSMEMVVLKNEW